MKKILTLGFITTFMLSCETEQKEQPVKVESPTVGSGVERTTMTIDGITYHLYATGASYSGVFVVNHTKEKLEVELIRKQLQEQ